MAVVRVLPALLLAMLPGGSCAPAEKAEPDPLAACAELGGTAPESIDDVIARVNALPEPRDVSCFVASLPRPLHVVATSSPFSLQPADGKLAPRIFIVSGKLIMSVVPRGPGAAYLELGELVDDRNSVKGELAFPPTGELAPDEPYARIVEEQRGCGFCHQGETPHRTRPHAFVSPAFKPSEDTLVSLTTLESIYLDCDTPEGEGEHCAMLRAMFDYGQVYGGAFPESVETIFEFSERQ